MECYILRNIVLCKTNISVLLFFLFDFVISTPRYCAREIVLCKTGIRIWHIFLCKISFRTLEIVLCKTGIRIWHIFLCKISFRTLDIVLCKTGIRTLHTVLCKNQHLSCVLYSFLLCLSLCLFIQNFTYCSL